MAAIDKDQMVEYEVEQGRKGPQAANVRPVTAAPKPADEPQSESAVEGEHEAEIE